MFKYFLMMVSFFSSMSVHAVPVTVSFTGVVDGVSTPLQAEFDTGNSYSGSFIYDTDFQETDDVPGWYGASVLDLNFEINGKNFTSDLNSNGEYAANSNGISIAGKGAHSFFSAGADSINGEEVNFNGEEFYPIYLDILNLVTDHFDYDSLPYPDEISGINLKNFQLIFKSDYSGEAGISGYLTSVNFSDNAPPFPAPEPASMLILFLPAIIIASKKLLSSF